MFNRYDSELVYVFFPTHKFIQFFTLNQTFVPRHASFEQSSTYFVTDDCCIFKKTNDFNDKKYILKNVVNE